MDTKKQTAFRLNDETLDYLKAYKEDHQLSSVTKALELIVKEHRAGSMKLEEAIANRVMELFESKYGNALTRIRLASRTADINSQIIIEIINSILYSGSATAVFIATDVMKNEIIEKSEEKVKARIAYYKQLNDDKKVKKAKENSDS